MYQSTFAAGEKLGAMIDPPDIHGLRVPQDIADVITNELVASTGDHSEILCNLKSCALVSDEFLRTSRRHLFHTIKLEQKCGIDALQTKFQSVLRTLLSSPHISMYIRQVVLEINPSNPEWNECSQLFCELLGLLGNVRYLEIKFQRAYSWDLLSPHVQIALSNIILRPTLEELSITRVNNFSMELIGCVQVVKLHSVLFDDCSNERELLTIPTDGLLEYPLRSLYLEDIRVGSEECILALVKHISPPRRQSRKLRVEYWSDIKLALAITEGHKYSVTTFEFPQYELNYFSKRYFDDIDFTPLINVHTIQLFTIFKHHGPHLGAAVEVLSKATENNNLQELIFYVLVAPANAAIPSPNIPKFNHWEALDTILFEQFSDLRSVEFRAASKGQFNGSTDGKKVVLRELLPRTHERGILKVDSDLRGGMILGHNM